MIYRKSYRPCPICRGELCNVRHLGHSYEQCQDCGGFFITRGTLGCMFAHVAQGSPLPEMGERTGAEARPCPACQQTMAHGALLGVPVEHCERHGLWFDRDELQAFLHRGAVRPPAPARPSVRIASPFEHLLGDLLDEAAPAPLSRRAEMPPTQVACGDCQTMVLMNEAIVCPDYYLCDRCAGAAMRCNECGVLVPQSHRHRCGLDATFDP